MNYILDANTLNALTKQEKGAEILAGIIDNSHNRVFIHAINLCEVYYGFKRESGKIFVSKVINDILKTKITLREDIDLEFWKQVGDFKSDFKESQ